MSFLYFHLLFVAFFLLALSSPARAWELSTNSDNVVFLENATLWGAGNKKTICYSAATTTFDTALALCRLLSKNTVDSNYSVQFGPAAAFTDVPYSSLPPAVPDVVCDPVAAAAPGATFESSCSAAAATATPCINPYALTLRCDVDLRALDYEFVLKTEDHILHVRNRSAPGDFGVAGAVCDDYIDKNTVQKICIALGYPPSKLQNVFWNRATAPNGTVSFAVDDLRCTTRGIASAADFDLGRDCSFVHLDADKDCSLTSEALSIWCDGPPQLLTSLMPLPGAATGAATMGRRLALLRPAARGLDPVLGLSEHWAFPQSAIDADMDAATRSLLCGALTPFDASACSVSSAESTWLGFQNLSCSAAAVHEQQVIGQAGDAVEGDAFGGGVGNNSIAQHCNFTCTDLDYTGDAVVLDFSPGLAFNVTVDPDSLLVEIRSGNASSTLCGSQWGTSSADAPSLDSVKTALCYFVHGRVILPSEIILQSASLPHLRRSADGRRMGQFYSFAPQTVGAPTVFENASWSWSEAPACAGDAFLYCGGWSGGDGDTETHGALWPSIDASHRDSRGQLSLRNAFGTLTVPVLMLASPQGYQYDLRLTAAALCRLDGYSLATVSTVTISSVTDSAFTGQAITELACKSTASSLRDCNFTVVTITTSGSFSKVILDCGVPRADVEVKLDPVTVPGSSQRVVLAKPPTPSSFFGSVCISDIAEENLQPFAQLVCQRLGLFTDKSRVAASFVSDTDHDTLRERHPVALSHVRCPVGASNISENCTFSEVHDMHWKGASDGFFRVEACATDQRLAVDCAATPRNWKFAIDDATKMLLVRESGGGGAALGTVCSSGFRGDTTATVVCGDAGVSAQYATSPIWWRRGITMQNAHLQNMTAPRLLGISCGHLSAQEAAIATIDDCMVSEISSASSSAASASAACLAGELNVGLVCSVNSSSKLPVLLHPGRATSNTELLVAPVGAPVASRTNFGGTVQDDSATALCFTMGYGLIARISKLGSYYEQIYMDYRTGVSPPVQRLVQNVGGCPKLTTTSVNDDCGFDASMAPVSSETLLYCGFEYWSRESFRYRIDDAADGGVVRLRVPGRQDLAPLLGTGNTSEWYLPIDVTFNADADTQKIADVVCRETMGQSSYSATSFEKVALKSPTVFAVCNVECATGHTWTYRYGGGTVWIPNSDMNLCKFDELCPPVVSSERKVLANVQCAATPTAAPIRIEGNTTFSPWSSGRSGSDSSSMTFVNVGLPILMVLVFLIIIGCGYAYYRRRAAAEEELEERRWERIREERERQDEINNAVMMVPMGQILEEYARQQQQVQNNQQPVDADRAVVATVVDHAPPVGPPRGYDSIYGELTGQQQQQQQQQQSSSPASSSSPVAPLSTSIVVGAAAVAAPPPGFRPVAPSPTMSIFTMPPSTPSSSGTPSPTSSSGAAVRAVDTSAAVHDDDDDDDGGAAAQSSPSGGFSPRNDDAGGEAHVVGEIIE